MELPPTSPYPALVIDRPPFRTAKTTDLEQWDLVWSAEHGWGIVREMAGAYHPASLSITVRLTDDFEEEDPVERCAGEVYYPDAAHAELFRGPMLKIAEPVRARGMVTDTIVRTQDPLQTAVDLGWGAVATRDSMPATFPTMSAVHLWGCAEILQGPLGEVREWASRCLRGVRDWSRPDFRDIRRRSLRSVGVLQSNRHVLARIASAHLEEDLEHSIGLRQVDDEADLLAKLEAQLTRAATPKGAQGARRRFMAAVVELRHTYGNPHHEAWEKAKQRGEKMVAARVAEMEAVRS